VEDDQSKHDDHDTNKGDLSVFSSLGEWLTGIPKIFQAPLLKAAGRLLLGVVNVPTAALDARAHDIKHRQQIKERVRTALAREVVARIPDREDFVERALENFANEVIGKQQNREEVLRHTVECLSLTPSNHEQIKSSDILDDDWLDSFSRYAENASSQHMRALFGQVLASEIRHPGSYSLFTLDFVAKIQAREAKLIAHLAPYVVDRFIILSRGARWILDSDVGEKLFELNLVRPAESNRYHNIATFENKEILDGRACNFLETARHTILIVTKHRNVDLQLKGHELTQVGREVMSLPMCDPDPEMLRQFAGWLKSPYAKPAEHAELYIGEVVERDRTKIKWADFRLIEPEFFPE
jgi:hypothetical protein